ncbi:hypothetical protein [Algoriphagus sp. NG3]|uniref:hypothetical protein n=1 Tax=Algoriphagus sp. NG3 TaxID=3097546 RepID=UPI002A83B130|nr:hypothetical protein [Algoriphagus sp. NG3]WPR76245.1 hypothetical protein SLW71_02655 [Algoriphagus sp. NG3]
MMRDIMLVIHLIGLVMGLGTSFAHAFLGKAISKLSPEEANKFHNQTKGLSLMGGIGILLLFVSGVYLIIPFWPAIFQLPLLVVKLVLFVILIVLIMMINLRAKRNMEAGIEKSSRSIDLMGKAALLIGVTIVLLAVSVFH